MLCRQHGNTQFQLVDLGFKLTIKSIPTEWGVQYVQMDKPSTGYAYFFYTHPEINLYRENLFIGGNIGVGQVSQKSWDGQSDGVCFLLEPEIYIKVTDNMYLGYGLHHMSNGGILFHNDGVNSHLLFLRFSL